MKTNFDFTKPVIFEGWKYYVRCIREKVGGYYYLRSFSEQDSEFYAEIYPNKLVKLTDIEQILNS